MGRVEALVEATDGVAQLVGPADAWAAAAIISDRFSGTGGTGWTGTGRQLANWLRLTFLNRAIINRDRTAVIGVGGTRLRAIVAISLVGAWAAPRIPKPWLVATTGLVAAASLQRGRLRRMVWITTALRRHAADAILVGEFAAREPGAGVAFAVETLDAIGTQWTLALTVQGTRGGRRTRSLVRLYKRLNFDVAARHSVGPDEILLMVRRSAAAAVPSTLRPAPSGS